MNTICFSDTFYACFGVLTTSTPDIRTNLLAETVIVGASIGEKTRALRDNWHRILCVELNDVRDYRVPSSPLRAYTSLHGASLQPL